MLQNRSIILFCFCISLMISFQQNSASKTNTTFWQRQRCSKWDFPPPKKKMTRNVIKKQNLAFGLTVLGFMYAHYTNKINKQKVINKSRCLLPYVMKFLAFGLTVFGFLYLHYTNKKLSTSQIVFCLMWYLVFGQVTFGLLCAHYIYNYVNQLLCMLWFSMYSVLSHTFSYFLILSHTFSYFLMHSHTFSKIPCL